ncbi:hypothetical protein ACT4MK_22175 [Bradyrhizobium barranii]|uniref:hypothetical protein n=1 Tax=Bradyrhizobium barranii TaxID=2992140 RepID=UPI0040344AAD
MARIIPARIALPSLWCFRPGKGLRREFSGSTLSPPLIWLKIHPLSGGDLLRAIGLGYTLRMFYGIRVNSALARLGIAPTLIETTYRRSMQKVGQASGNTPQEVALYIAAQLPLIHRVNLPAAIVRQWIESGKIKHKSDEMREALGTLCLWDLMSMP